MALGHSDVRTDRMTNPADTADGLPNHREHFEEGGSAAAIKSSPRSQITLLSLASVSVVT